MRTYFFPPYEPEYDDKKICIVIDRIVMFKEARLTQGATEIYLDNGDRVITSLDVNSVNKIINGE
ncbi:MULTISPECIES: hypothetical protein [Providencia]|uniref:hypothetical protein n=1 Tax=Providencia TaxID=586 RepID=UPI0019047A4B|nr:MULTISPECIES: hypothetical protein [Providencia]MBJ9972940.1 hypothetical protein [Providencia rettgeri]MCF8964725.1 hypothetical protein [Providencia rettgeri]UDQ67255.1 hypothetical protein LHK11_19585 [Providencia rettgeri]HEM6856052.1 hypothetical protein [Providencia rettgeri]